MYFRFKNIQVITSCHLLPIMWRPRFDLYKLQRKMRIKSLSKNMLNILALKFPNHSNISQLNYVILKNKLAKLTKISTHREAPLILCKLSM